MNLRALIAGPGLAVVVALASCSSPPQEPPVLAPPAHDYKVAQFDKSGLQSFEMCRDCPKPTRKTLPSPPVRVAAAPVPVPPPKVQVPKAPRQFTAFIHFELNSAKLTEQSRSQIAAIAPLLKLSTDARVTGFTDDLGGQDLNAKLSDARALAVVLALRDQLDVSAKQPSLSGTGRPLCCYVSDNRGEAKRQPNRRAEVLMTVQDSPELHRALKAMPETTRLRETGTPTVAAALAGDARAQPTQP